MHSTDAQQVHSDEEIKARAREVLYKNMISGRKGGFHYHYTKPSPGTYPFQYFWDTCFHIFTLTALGEVEMAKKHVHSLLQMQGPDGFVGHMNYWKRLWPARGIELIKFDCRIYTISSTSCKDASVRHKRDFHSATLHSFNKTYMD